MKHHITNTTQTPGQCQDHAAQGLKISQILFTHVSHVHVYDIVRPFARFLILSSRIIKESLQAHLGDILGNGKTNRPICFP